MGVKPVCSFTRAASPLINRSRVSSLLAHQATGLLGLLSAGKRRSCESVRDRDEKLIEWLSWDAGVAQDVAA